jgi:hypothetical protein
VAACLGRVDHADLANAAELGEDLRDGTVPSGTIQLSLQKAHQHQCQDAAEDVDLDLLVGPVVLRPQSDVMRALEGTEGTEAIQAPAVGRSLRKDSLPRGLAAEMSRLW